MSAFFKGLRPAGKRGRRGGGKGRKEYGSACKYLKMPREERETSKGGADLFLISRLEPHTTVREKGGEEKKKMTGVC